MACEEFDCVKDRRLVPSVARKTKSHRGSERSTHAWIANARSKTFCLFGSGVALVIILVEDPMQSALRAIKRVFLVGIERARPACIVCGAECRGERRMRLSNIAGRASDSAVEPRVIARA